MEIIAGVKRSKRESRFLCPVQTAKETTVPQAHMRALASTIRNSFIEIKEEKPPQLTSHFKCAPKHTQEDNLNKQDKQRMGDRKITNFIKHDGKWWIKNDRLTQGHAKSVRSQVHSGAFNIIRKSSFPKMQHFGSGPEGQNITGTFDSFFAQFCFVLKEELILSKCTMVAFFNTLPKL